MNQVLICDDHALVRTAIARVLETESQLQVVGQADDASGLEELLDSGVAPDLLLMDLNVGPGGVPAGLQLIDRLCRANSSLRVVVLSMHTEPEVVDRALRAGAKGFVAKGSAMQVLLQAIGAVRDGSRFIDPALVDALLQLREKPAAAWDASLTPRERDILARLCSGQRLQLIANELGVSIKTVSTHKMRLMEKLGISNNAELVRLGQRHGLS